MAEGSRNVQSPAGVVMTPFSNIPFHAKVLRSNAPDQAMSSETGRPFTVRVIVWADSRPEVASTIESYATKDAVSSSAASAPSSAASASARSFSASASAFRSAASASPTLAASVLAFVSAAASAAGAAAASGST